MKHKIPPSAPLTERSMTRIYLWLVRNEFSVLLTLAAIAIVILAFLN